MEISIREATINDLGKIQKLSKKLFENEYKHFNDSLILDWPFLDAGIKYYSDRINNDDGVILLAIINEEIVAYICGAIKEKMTHRNIDVIAELDDMFVISKERSSGIGGMLVDELFEWAKQKGASKIGVTAHFNNSQAIKFYKNKGFLEEDLLLEADIK